MTLSPWKYRLVTVTGALVILALCAVTSFSAQRTIEYIYLAGIEASEQAQAAATAAFEADNPDIKVDRIRVQANYQDRLIALIASGTVPDVISLDMNYIMSFGDERFIRSKTPGSTDSFSPVEPYCPAHS